MNKRTLSDEAIIRIEGMAHEENLNKVKELLPQLYTAWINEGFEHEEIQEYLSLILDYYQTPLEDACLKVWHREMLIFEDFIKKVKEINPTLTTEDITIWWNSKVEEQEQFLKLCNRIWNNLKGDYVGSISYDSIKHRFLERTELQGMMDSDRVLKWLDGKIEEYNKHNGKPGPKVKVFDWDKIIDDVFAIWDSTIDDGREHIEHSLVSNGIGPIVWHHQFDIIPHDLNFESYQLFNKTVSAYFLKEDIQHEYLDVLTLRLG